MTNKLKLSDYSKESSFYQDLPIQELNRLLANIASKKSRSKSMSKMSDYDNCLEIEQLIKDSISAQKPDSDKKLTLTIENVQKVDSFEEITKIVKNIQSQKCLAKLMSKNDKWQKMVDLEIIAKNVRNSLEPDKMSKMSDIVNNIELLKIDINLQDMSNIQLIDTIVRILQS